MPTFSRSFSAIATTLAFASTLSAHDGRRFEILVVDDQLTARGYNSAGVNDGGGVQRAYYNALHDHWAFNPAPGVVAASADLPGFDLFTPGVLTGHSVTATLVGSSRWMSPPHHPPAGTAPVFEPLGPGQEIFASYNTDLISTGAPGAITLIDSASPAGELDIDIVYDIADEPTAQIMVLEFVLSTSAPGVADSDPVHIILSPDGSNPMERLHHAALYTEKTLGNAVCAADIDLDNDADPDDIAAFVTAFIDGAPGNADVDGDGDEDPDDIAAFVDAFIAGCGS